MKISIPAPNALDKQRGKGYDFWLAICSDCTRRWAGDPSVDWQRPRYVVFLFGTFVSGI